MDVPCECNAQGKSRIRIFNTSFGAPFTALSDFHFIEPYQVPPILCRGNFIWFKLLHFGWRSLVELQPTTGLYKIHDMMLFFQPELFLRGKATSDAKPISFFAFSDLEPTRPCSSCRHWEKAKKDRRFYKP